MKLKIKVTKDILKQSMMCGVAESRGIVKHTNTAVNNCAIALSVRDVFPNACVYPPGMLLFGKVEPISTIKEAVEASERVDWIDNSQKTEDYIRTFDGCLIYPQARLSMPEYEFTIKVPEAVIDSINIEVLEACPTMELVGD